MRVLVTGSSGHLGEVLMRTLRDRGADVIGLDLRPSEWTNAVGSVADADLAREVMTGVDVVSHTATLHKPQLASLPRQAFVDTNVTGTLALLDTAADACVQAFVMSSSTTVFGDALVPARGEPAAWIDESVVPVPKNIYGVTKAAAEDLCQLAFRNQGLPCVVLRVSRFFPEADDMPDAHEGAQTTTSRPTSTHRAGWRSRTSSMRTFSRRTGRHNSGISVTSSRPPLRFSEKTYRS
jgi:UDP-glucose 4-epimerase